MSNDRDDNIDLPALRNGTTPEREPDATPTGLQARHRGYLEAATSENTRRSYRSAIRHFERWGGYLPTDRDTLIRYLLDHAATLYPRTLDARLTALSQWHHYQGFVDPTQDPTVRKTLKGIRHKHGKPARKAKALRLEHIATMLAELNQRPESLKRTRDLALIQVGFFGAFRRSELIAIRVEDLMWEPEGLIIQLPRSKTDQSGEGLHRALPKGVDNVCPVKAMKLWLTQADINSGPVFRAVNRWGQVQNRALNPGAVNELLKSLGEACGFEFAKELSSHSFRRGLSTSAAREDVDFKAIKQQGGWKNDATVWGYIDEGRRFSDNAAQVLLAKVESLINETE
jgi:integrase